MGLFDDFLKNLDDSLATFEKTVQKIDDKLNATADKTEQVVTNADATLKKVDVVSQKAVDIVTPKKQSSPKTD